MYEKLIHRIVRTVVGRDGDVTLEWTTRSEDAEGRFARTFSIQDIGAIERWLAQAQADTPQERARRVVDEWTADLQERIAREITAAREGAVEGF